MRNAYQVNCANNYDNDATRAIDSQKVVAPQYGMIGSIRPDPSTPPKSGKRHSPSKAARAPVHFNYNVRAQRTKALKRDKEILSFMLQDALSDTRMKNSRVVELMKRRLTLMSSELTRRDLRDLAGGKVRNGSFYSLAARIKAA
jgi:hypothetical protein